MRGVSRDLQQAGLARAVREGTTLRRVLLQGLHEYAAGTWTPQPEGTLGAAPGLDPRGTARPAGPGKFGHIHHYIVLVFALIVGLTFAAARAADGEVPNAADMAACNEEAPQSVKTGRASPTVADRARAERARGAVVSADPPAVAGKTIESPDPQIHGMEKEGAKNAAYQAGYRSCMRRKGF